MKNHKSKYLMPPNYIALGIEESSNLKLNAIPTNTEVVIHNTDYGLQISIFKLARNRAAIGSWEIPEYKLAESFKDLSKTCLEAAQEYINKFYSYTTP